MYEICLYNKSSDNFQNILGVIRTIAIRGVSEEGQVLELTQDLYNRLLADIWCAVESNQRQTIELVGATSVELA